jgi:hypothetical protein
VERLVVPAHRDDRRAAHQRQRVADRGAAVEAALLEGGIVLRLGHATQEPPAAVDQVVRPAEQHDVGVGPHERDLLLEAVGDADVVGVHPRDELAAGEPEALVERLGEAGVRAADQADAVVDGGVLVEDRGRAVRRTVVDQDQLEVAERLREDAVERLREVALGIEDRHDHRDDGNLRHA